LARWVEAPDPVSQVESRAVPYDSGLIRGKTVVRIPATLFRKYRSSSSEGRKVFDYLAMQISHVFPFWKGTRADFRFTDNDQTVAFVLTPMKRFIRVEIRTDVTGYRDRRNLFPTAPSAGAAYPGTWIRANVSEITVAASIADDICGERGDTDDTISTPTKVEPKQVDKEPLFSRSAATEFSAKIKGLVESTRDHFPERDAWKKLDDDGVWKHIVYQVCVVGSSASYERMINSSTAQTALRYNTVSVLDADEQARVINKVLRDHGVRYASANLAKCPKTKALVKNLDFLAGYKGGPTGYVKKLSLLDENERIEVIMRDLSYIKLKGARDLLAELGLAHNVIALDSRVLGILRSFGADVPKETPTDVQKYQTIQKALLSQICEPLGLTGVELDRILYWNYQNIRKF